VSDPVLRSGPPSNPGVGPAEGESSRVPSRPARGLGETLSPTAEQRAIVLYVDDDRANLLAFRAMAEPQYEVVTARSGEDALKLLGQLREVAVLIADQRMPGMSGIDLCERVRAGHPDVVRMLVTAYSDLTAAIAAINRGHVSRYLHKPWNADELMATLRDAVERYRLSVTVQRMQLRISETERMYALGVLTASIGHELRTPLSIVNSNLRFARRALSELLAHGQLPEAGRRSLSELEAALVDADDGAQRLMEVVEGISLSARSEPITQQPVDLAHVVRSVLRLIRSEAAPHAQLIVEQAATPQVIGSATRVGQVLLNLLLNALQAMPSRPVSANQVKVRLSEENGRALIEVSDNGTGIDPQNLRRIFDPFFTTKRQGTGLGLAISRQIIEETGGELSVASELGVGTRFTVSWPVVPPR
jgi:signal transduction histidine kinase